MLLDQNNREHAIDAFRPDLSSASFQRPQSETNVASGCPLFFPLTKLQSPKHAYVKDDTMFLKCWALGIFRPSQGILKCSRV